MQVSGGHLFDAAEAAFHGKSLIYLQAPAAFAAGAFFVRGHLEMPMLS